MTRTLLALKLGSCLGIAWAMIFAGCLLNTKGNIIGSAEITAVVMGAVFFVIFAAPQWVPDLIPENKIKELGGEKKE